MKRVKKKKQGRKKIETNGACEDCVFFCVCLLHVGLKFGTQQKRERDGGGGCKEKMAKKKQKQTLRNEVQVIKERVDEGCLGEKEIDANQRPQEKTLIFEWITRMFFWEATGNSQVFSSRFTKAIFQNQKKQWA
ncbi:MAG: hypothetical protein Pars93KO_28170 [Parasphingorhabdus sp.]